MTAARLAAKRAAPAGDRGSELIEMAMVLPIFILIIMAIIDFGYLFQRYEVVNNAAREAARLAATGTISNDDAETRALNYLNGAGLTSTDATAEVADGTMDIGGVTVSTTTATVTYPTSFIFLPGSVNLRGVSVMRVDAGS